MIQTHNLLLALCAAIDFVFSQWCMLSVGVCCVCVCVYVCIYILLSSL